MSCPESWPVVFTPSTPPAYNCSHGAMISLESAAWNTRNLVNWYQAFIWLVVFFIWQSISYWPQISPCLSDWERITDPSRPVEADRARRGLSLVFLNIIIIQKHNEVLWGHPGWRYWVVVRFYHQVWGEERSPNGGKMTAKCLFLLSSAVAGWVSILTSLWRSALALLLLHFVMTLNNGHKKNAPVFVAN